MTARIRVQESDKGIPIISVPRKFDLYRNFNKLLFLQVIKISTDFFHITMNILLSAKYKYIQKCELVSFDAIIPICKLYAKYNPKNNEVKYINENHQIAKARIFVYYKYFTSKGK